MSVCFCVSIFVFVFSPVCVLHLPGHHVCLSVYVLFVNRLHPCLCAFVFLSPVCVLHLPGHHGEELGEVDRAVAVGVHLGDNS